MALKPDLSDISKKFDINNIVSSIKSLLNPESATPEVDPDDAIGVKIAQLSLMMQQLAKSQAQQAKDFTAVNQLLNELYKDIETLRNLKPTPPKNDSDVKNSE